MVFFYAFNCVMEHSVDSLSINCEHTGQETKEKGINLINLLKPTGHVMHQHV